VEIVSNLPLYAVIIPIIGALLLIFIPEKDDEVRNPLALITSIITAGVVILIIQQVFAGNILSYKLVEIMPGLEFAFRVDPFGALFGGVASILWVFTVLYAIGYMSFGHNRRRFFIFFLLSLSVTMGIALAANLFTLYLFYELLTLATSCTNGIVKSSLMPKTMAVRANTAIGKSMLTGASMPLAGLNSPFLKKAATIMGKK
jgi:multicomponent Na+:H+ antiporter subunit D